MMQESVMACANSVGWFHISIIGFSYDLHSKKWHISTTLLLCPSLLGCWGAGKPDVPTG
ncbi:MAG: hypothetical protein IKQ75_07000 [Bacteroidales bacterium]|nr:hypothetical protein [Bacteroidales bacterium]MCR4738055.1 hypothetical protein [Bacteroidales bacterium]